MFDRVLKIFATQLIKFPNSVATQIENYFQVTMFSLAYFNPFTEVFCSIAVTHQYFRYNFYVYSEENNLTIPYECSSGAQA